MKARIIGNNDRDAVESFMNLVSPSKGESYSIDEILKAIGEYFLSDRAFIIEQHEDKEFMSSTFEWCSPNVTPEMGILKYMPYSDFEFWKEMFNRTGTFYLTKDQAHETIVQKILIPHNIDSIMCSPIFIDGEIIGFLGIDNPRLHTDFLLLFAIMSSILYKEIQHQRESVLIEELKKAKSELENINMSVSNAGLGIWGIYGFETGKMGMGATDQMKRLLGIENFYMTNEEIYNRWYSRIVPEDLDSVKKSCNEMISGKHSENVYRWNHPTKGVMYVRCGGTRVPTEDGSILLEGYHYEVTDYYISEQEGKRKLAEYIDRLEESEEILASAGFGIYKFLCDEKGVPYGLTGNDKWAELLGIPEDCVTLQDRFMFYISRITEETKDKAESFTFGGNDNQIAIRIFSFDHPTKGVRYFTAGGTNHIDRNGNITFSGYIGDVTEEYLEDQRISNSLKNALDEAKAASTAKTVFLNNMSHDIRTPMNAILGFASIMKKRVHEPDVVLDYVNKIQSAGGYLLSIINNVLDMARIESGKIEINEEVYHIDEDNSSTIMIFEDSFAKRHIQFEHYYNIVHPYVYADVTKVNQIMANLLSNAAKYSVAGGKVVLRLSEIECDISGYCTYVLEVSDNGIGMTKEFADKIFDSFSRERNTTESGIVGSGLGMSIVKKLVDILGGTIEVFSEVGKGTTFKVTMNHKIADKPKNEPMIIQSGEIDLSILEGKRVLLAEDNILNAEIANAILEDAGMVVEHAGDGLICVDKLKKNTYDIVLMDIQMPNMNGYDATIEIRKLSNSKKSSIPIIAMTANAFDEDRKKALSVGMNAHISKPIVVKDLLNTMAQFLK